MPTTPRIPWRRMSTAPKNREIILRIHNYMLGRDVAIGGCWLIPSGLPELAGWHAGSAVTGSRSEQPGVPFKIVHSPVEPTGWMDYPIPAPTFF